MSGPGGCRAGSQAYGVLPDAGGLAARAALAAIGWYQRRLSPRKGFCCAYRAVTGRQSCSAYARRAIARRGLRAGLALLRRRFAACAQAASLWPGRAGREVSREPVSASCWNGGRSYVVGDCASQGAGACCAAWLS